MTDHGPHISDLRWDRLLAGELPAEERDAALAHAATCAACATRQRDLTDQRDAFAHPMRSFATLTTTCGDDRATTTAPAAPRDDDRLATAQPGASPATPRPAELASARAHDASATVPASPPSDDLAAARARKRSRAMWLAPLGAVAAAATLLLVVGRGGDAPTGEQTKGHGPALALSVEQAGRLVPLGAGDVVHPNDRLQATYTANVDGYGAVLARDGAGIASAYVPSSGDLMVTLPAATDAAFPESTVLDDVTGTERIAIVWCAEARPLAPLIAAMSTGAPLAEPAGCHIRELALAKQVPP